MDTDTDLIESIVVDLDGTFERLVALHQDRLYSIALRMLGDPRDAYVQKLKERFLGARRVL